MRTNRLLILGSVAGASLLVSGILAHTANSEDYACPQQPKTENAAYDLSAKNHSGMRKGSDPIVAFPANQTAPSGSSHEKLRGYIMIGYSSTDSYVLVVDPEGHRFGVDSCGKPVPREIVRGFYEDDDTAQMETDLPPERQPQVISIDEPRSGKYRVVVTARKNGNEWLKVKVWTKNKLWKQEFTIPSAAAGSIAPLSLKWEFLSESEPEVLMQSHPLKPTKSEFVILKP